jgi:hypothetical protein
MGPTPSVTAATTAQTLAGAGNATGPTAAGDAVRAALAGLDDPGLVVLFPSAALNPCDASAQAAAEAGATPVVGMAARAELSIAGPTLGGCTALALDASVSHGAGVAHEASNDLRAAGRAAAADALAAVDPRHEHCVLLLFLDHASGDQAEAVAGAYAAAGPRVPLAGGAAGGPDGCVFAGGGAYRDTVVAVALSSPNPIGLGIADGCVPRSSPGIVTRADGRTLRLIDGRPAAEVYLEKIGHAGETLSAEAFEKLAVLHPLAQPELSGDLRLRHVHSRTEDGALECSTCIPANAAVRFMEQSTDSILRSAWDAVSDALSPLPESGARAALVFDCAGRRAAAGDALASEVEALVASFGSPTPPLAGLYTYGEVGRVRGAKGDRNHALVVVALS